jgi:hypothetical protein
MDLLDCETVVPRKTLNLVEGYQMHAEIRGCRTSPQGDGKKPECPERVFDGLSSHAHGLGLMIEPVLHPVEHLLILPTLDEPQLGWRALGSERTGEAGAQVAVAVEVFGVIRPAPGLGEFCPRRAGVVVVLGVVEEVLPGEEAAFGPARRQGLKRPVLVED